jgi:hypothetical protein
MYYVQSKYGITVAETIEAAVESWSGGAQIFRRDGSKLNEVEICEALVALLALRRRRSVSL